MSAIYECECDSFEMYEEQDSFEMDEAVPGLGVPPGGLTGQVLKKRSDEDFDTEWADESGGGGGTSDYTQLSNKPQINGNTLTGNKTGADLGLVNAVPGKQLSTEDYTSAEKTKLDGIEAQANKTVIDSTLTIAGQAADAKKTGDEINDLKDDVEDLQDIAGDGALDSDFTATDLTGAANELKDDVSDLRNTLNQLNGNIGKILPVITGSTNNSGYTINAGDYFEANGDLYKANTSIPINGAWSSSATAQTNTAVNTLAPFVDGTFLAEINTYNGSYTPTENCWAFVIDCKGASSQDAQVFLNGHLVVGAGADNRSLAFPVKAGQTVTTRNASTGTYYILFAKAL